MKINELRAIADGNIFPGGSMSRNDELGRFDGMTNVEILHYLIDRLPDATSDETKALHEIMDVEGFGGREDLERSKMAEVAEERLEWFRQQRSERVQSAGRWWNEPSDED